MDAKTLNEPAWNSRFLQGKNLPQALSEAISDLHSAHFVAYGNKLEYGTLRNSKAQEALVRVERALPSFDPNDLSDWKEATAFWLNCYNALFIHSVQSLLAGNSDDKVSINELPGLFSDFNYNIGGFKFALDDIEHGVLRANSSKYMSLNKVFDKGDPRADFSLRSIDPRIHFAFFIGAFDSPDFRVFTADNIEAELDQATQTYLSRSAHLDEQKAKLKLPKQFSWYRKDFGSNKDLLGFVYRHLPNIEMREKIRSQASSLSISHNEYDWRLRH